MVNNKYNILMVDDSKTFNQKITDALREMGHTVQQSYNLKDTKEFINNNKYDFIILDLILPDGEGDEVIDFLDDEQKAKVIVLSGDTDMQRRNHIFNSGILEYYSKTNPTNIIINDIKNLLLTIETNKNINVLTVDDSAFMRRLIKGLLSPKKYNILEAKNGEEALKILEETTIQLMLCDLEMPVMDGVKLVEKIKQQQKHLELPIIMISSKDDKNLIARILKHGARDFIKKPFSSEEFLLKCDLHIKGYLNVESIKQKEKQLQEILNTVQKNEDQKLMFLANMSHELRTPLNGIIGFAELLKEEISDDGLLELVNNIQHGGDHLLHIINDILDFSKISCNKLDIVKENFEIKELVNSLFSLNSLNAKNKNIDFSINVNKDLPLKIKGDYLRIKQIIMNLTSNAIKFTQPGGKVTIDISFNESKDKIGFMVTDTGIGIDSKNHKKIFDLFEQAEENTSKKFGGTGLGLNISSKLVELLGGTLNLESEQGKGAKFFFEIDFEEAQEKAEIVQDSTEKLEQLTFDNEILLVEDNIMNQQLMSIILKKLGLRFDVANDGFDAVEKYKQNKYDLILMDENMPNMSGTEAVKHIREYEMNTTYHYTPIIALTANAIVGDREKFISAGMDEYMAKPLKRTALVEMLDRFLIKEDYEKPDLTPVKKEFNLDDVLEAVKNKDLVEAQKILEILKSAKEE